MWFTNFLVMTHETLQFDGRFRVTAELDNRKATTSCVFNGPPTSFSQVARSVLYFGLLNQLQLNAKVTRTRRINAEWHINQTALQIARELRLARQTRSLTRHVTLVSLEILAIALTAAVVTEVQCRRGRHEDSGGGRRGQRAIR